MGITRKEPMKPIKVSLPPGIGSKEPKYSVMLLMPKPGKETRDRIDAAIRSYKQNH